MSVNPKPVTFRIVLIGNAQVGKTSIVQRLVNREFTDHYEETVGAAFFTYTHNVRDQTVLLQIWDTAGQEKYQSLGPIYYRNSAAAIAVYDQKDPESFKSLPDWITAFQSSANSSAQVFVVGNKNDLEELVPQTQAEDYSAQNGYSFISVSAKTGQNIDRLFQMIAQNLLSDSDENVGTDKTEDAVNLQTTENPQKDGCC